MTTEPTTTDILEAISAFSTKVDIQFGQLQTDVAGLKTDVAGLKTDMRMVQATMVTKDYLDDKLADLRGDLVVLTRKEDTKLRVLIEVLHKKSVLTDPDMKRILSMEPFPQLYLH